MKQKKSGRKAVALLAVFNVLLLCISVFCVIRTHQNNERINQADRSFQYLETENDVVLTLSNGREVHMVFGRKAVRILRAYRYADSMCDILLFVREYGVGHSVIFQRTNTELLGEFRLHTLLFRLGYKCEQTGDLDWDYGLDPRWYVNVASSVIGRCGL